MDLRVLKAERVEDAPEILIYFWIQTLGDFLWTMHRATTRHGADPAAVGPDCENARHDQERLVAMLKTRDGFAFKDHAEYMLWFLWWNQWHKSELRCEQWDELNHLLRWDGTQTEETFAAWRPQGNWREVEAAVSC